MKLKMKDNKLFGRNCIFRQVYITRKFELQRSFVDKGSGSSIFPDLDLGDPNRLDPTGSGSA